MRRGLLLLCAAGSLALPSAASALLDWHTVRVTAGGPQPRVVHVYAGVSAVAWFADGAAAAKVVFDDGSCSVRVGRAGRILRGCTFGPGLHRYRIVGLPASIGSGTVVARRAP